MSVYDGTIPVFEQLLNALSAIIDKAKAHVESAQDRSDRVDLGRGCGRTCFRLIKQVQVACDWRQERRARGWPGSSRRNSEDNETTLDELKARAGKTLDYLQSLKRDGCRRWR